MEKWLWVRPTVPVDGVHVIVGSEQVDGPDRESSLSTSLVVTVSQVNVTEVFPICVVTRANASANKTIMKENCAKRLVFLSY